MLIGLTILAYRYEGLRRGDLCTTVRHLKEKAASEKGPFRERPTTVLFRRWVTGAKARICDDYQNVSDKLAVQDSLDGHSLTPAAYAALVELQNKLARQLVSCETLEKRPLDKIHLDEDSQVSTNSCLRRVLHTPRHSNLTRSLFHGSPVPD